MARYLGDAAGRASKQYTDTSVDAACTALCGYVNTEVSTLNTSKLGTSGDGSNLTNIVTSLTGGSGVSVDASTGAITVSASGEGVVDVLYHCGCCWNGQACIPADKRHAYTHYEILGSANWFSYYCSSATFCFAPWSGCSATMTPGYCCMNCACGWIGANKCFYSTARYDCAGQIPWAMGCESDCRTACTGVSFIWHARISPENPCNGSCRGWQYCFNKSNNGGSQCCLGIRNSGYAYNCCGTHPACMQCVCMSTPSGSNPFSCMSTVTILGFGRIAGT